MKRGGGENKNVTLDSIRHLKSRQRLLGNICEMEAVWDLIGVKKCDSSYKNKRGSGIHLRHALMERLGSFSVLIMR